MAKTQGTVLVVTGSGRRVTGGSLFGLMGRMKLGCLGPRHDVFRVLSCYAAPEVLRWPWVLE